MIGKIRALVLRHREVLLYLIFGGLTTLVDWSISFLLYRLWTNAMEQRPWIIHVADCIAWIAAVLFAYFTNRIWVFKSRKRGAWILLELASFAGGRVLTLLLQEVIIALFVTWLGLNKYLFKILAAVLVVILNYLISKLLIFRKKNKTPGKPERT